MIHSSNTPATITFAFLALAATSISHGAVAQSHGFELEDAKGQRGQSVTLPIVFSQETRAALQASQTGALTVLGLPLNAWLNTGTATGRGWRIDGPALATALKQLQVTTNPGEQSQHLVEIQLTLAKKETPLSRLMALSLQATPPDIERIASASSKPEPKTDTKPAPVQALPETATVLNEKPEPQIPSATIKSTEPNQPTAESVQKPPEPKTKSPSAPSRLAAMIPKLWTRPKPEPSGLGASAVVASKSEERFAALPSPTPLPHQQLSKTPEQTAPPSRQQRTDSRSASEKADPMFRRAKQMIETGDVAGARLLLSHLAKGGSAAAAFEMAKTFEATFLEQRSIWGLKPDAKQAELWYTKARDLGYQD